MLCTPDFFKRSDSLLNGYVEVQIEIPVLHFQQSQQQIVREVKCHRSLLFGDALVFISTLGFC